MHPSHIHRTLVLAVALLLAPVAALAQGLTALQVAEIENVTSAAISPDGRHVAYTVSKQANPFEQNTPPQNHLYVLDTQTGASTALHTTSSVGALGFRPVQGTVTFLASIEEGAARGLYEIAVTGGAPSRILTHDTSILGYVWSPNGERVAFMANERIAPPATPLPYAPIFFEENLAQRQAFIHDFDGDGEPRLVQHVGSYHILTWGPDSERLAVSVAPTPRVDDMFMYQSVKVVDGASGAVIADIDNAGKIAQIEWSPNGRYLALRAGHNINDPIDGRIMVVSAEGGAPQNIAPDFQGKFEQISWTGEDQITFIASEGTAKTYGTIRPDGSGFTRIVADPEMNLVGFSRNDAGAVAFVVNTPRHPSEVYVMAAGADAPARMTDRNPWLAEVPMGEQRVVTYTARDGAFDIEGLLILPVGYEEGTRVPLITVVHGGPEAHYSNGWLTAYSLPGQMSAARGFAVFYPNYRGSTGRGLEFIKSSQADLAGAEFDDIVDGVDYLIQQGIVDGDRVGVTGGSYGGYATAWMSTRYSERFAAGVMFVGISNNISKWGTSDIPDELYLVHTRERMWESEEKWMDTLHRSPIYHVENAQTPLLIMHGAEDTRVHPAQSLELYRHLVVRRPDVPVRLILYPDEGHGNVRAASRFDYNVRMLEWFDAFLMGDGVKPGLDITMPEEAAHVGG